MFQIRGLFNTTSEHPTTIENMRSIPYPMLTKVIDNQASNSIEKTCSRMNSGNELSNFRTPSKLNDCYNPNYNYTVNNAKSTAQYWPNSSIVSYSINNNKRNSDNTNVLCHRLFNSANPYQSGLVGDSFILNSRNNQPKDIFLHRLQNSSKLRQVQIPKKKRGPKYGSRWKNFKKTNLDLKTPAVQLYGSQVPRYMSLTSNASNQIANTYSEIRKFLFEYGSVHNEFGRSEMLDSNNSEEKPDGISDLYDIVHYSDMVMYGLNTINSII